MEETPKGPRVLLRRLREVMAEALEPQERLDKIVQQIASNMRSEVCSLYVLRADKELELFATEGLKKEAVHNVSMRINQGLVGTIAANARLLNLPDAQKHPAFTYFPETGEELFNSFLGVPVLRAGRTLGVLVVQSSAHRTFRDDEVEALETTAMVMAELIIAGELEQLNSRGIGLDRNRPYTHKSVPLSDGIGLGHVLLHEPRVVVTNLFNESADDELKKLSIALGELRISIDDMLARGDVAREGDHRDVLEAYRMFANDRGWVRRLEEAINNGLTAEAAVEKVQNDNRARMMRMSDPYLRERLHDFDDLAQRLLRQLMGRTDGMAAKMPKDTILVSRAMGAAELLDYPRENLRGLILEDAGPNSHVVIVARALGIPVIGQPGNMISMAENGDAAIVDGDDGAVHLRPTPDIENAYVEKVRFRATRQKHYREMVNEPSVSKDGVHVELTMNAGLVVDLPQLQESGASGIGLFRTELQFMVSSTFPRPGEQEKLYREVLDEAGGKKVTFRTLDVGGDKVLPYLRSVPEENPAMGWRAIRLSIDRPGLLRAQLRALMKAASGRELSIMLPMVTDVSEVKTVRDVIRHEKQLLEKFEYRLPTKIDLGAMIETPMLLFQLDELMNCVDFVSIGTNDLFQFMAAADRGNAHLTNRFDAKSRPFLRAIRSIVEAGERHNTPISLCGEIAGRPLAAMAMIGLGVRSLSMSPAAIGPVKAMLLSLDVEQLSVQLNNSLNEYAGGQTIREFLNDFADANSIPY